MTVLQYENYIIVSYCLVAFLAKFSILLQLQHIFVASHRQPVYYVIYALIWANLAFFATLMFVGIFQCIPREKIWNQTMPGRCISLDVLLLAPAGINMTSDVAILVLPIILVYRLQITLRKKTTIAAVFGSGAM